LEALAGTSFQLFSGGGQNFYRLPRAGQNVKKTKFSVQKHKKITIFLIQGGGNAPLPPPNDVPQRLYNPNITYINKSSNFDNANIDRQLFLTKYYLLTETYLTKEIKNKI